MNSSTKNEMKQRQMTLWETTDSATTAGISEATAAAKEASTKASKAEANVAEAVTKATEAINAEATAAAAVRVRRSGVNYHPAFYEYVEAMVAHPNYEGLPFDRTKDGRVRWVVLKNSPQGQRRLAWWDAKCAELGVAGMKGCYAMAARKLHPTGWHVCQCCGKRRSIFFEYPSRRAVPLINRALGIRINKDSDSERVELTMREIIDLYCDSEEKMHLLARAFDLPQPRDRQELTELLYEHHVRPMSRMVSPGVMCNPPDRFNGYHSYALCCRTRFDRGRSVDNMKTYTQDRRAYEQWADGDFSLANRLMGEFRKQPPMVCPVCGEVHKMTADHIGPISLGFCHSRNFAPMCSKCNTAKNNRLSKADVDRLLAIEAEGTQVISWHSQHIWDALKHTVTDNAEALFVSSVMAKCHQNVLNILALINRKGGSEFLMRYLHPEYALWDYRFENVDLTHLENLLIIRTRLNRDRKSVV